MKIFSASEIKQRLSEASSKELLDYCLRLSRFKKENKELLSYLLFDAHDLPAYIDEIKNDMDEQFSQVNTSQLYFAKKNLRKIIRTVNRYARYIQSKEAEAGLLIYFCQKMRALDLPLKKSTVLTNLYAGQVKKIRGLVAGLHEDLQYDLNKETDLL